MRSSFTCSEIIDQYNSIDLRHLYKRSRRPRSLTAESVMSKMASLALQPLSFACRRRMSHNVLKNMSPSTRYNAPLISIKICRGDIKRAFGNQSFDWRRGFRALLNFNPTRPWWGSTKTPRKARSIDLKGPGWTERKGNNARLCAWRYRKSLMRMDFLLKAIRVSGGLDLETQAVIIESDSGLSTMTDWVTTIITP